MTDYRKRLEDELEEIGGCHDRDCKVFVTPGVHTNGGCRCLRDAYTGQRVFRAYKRAVDDQEAEITRLRADITALEDGNMTWMCDQLDKAKAENARMREALEQIADGSAPPIPHGHYVAHRRAVDVARVALSVKAG